MQTNLKNSCSNFNVPNTLQICSMTSDRQTLWETKDFPISFDVSNFLIQHVNKWFRAFVKFERKRKKVKLPSVTHLD